MPDFSRERELAAKADIGAAHPFRIAGIDEVGRGPWAGPVTACAVILDWATFPKDLAAQLDDSKKLTAKRRAALLPDLTEHATFAVAEASVDEVDALNILQASFLAMRRAVDALPEQPNAALVDGNRDPGLPCPSRLVIKGDSKSLSIAAASIIAKEHRDEKMAALALDFPDYGWDKNAGYGVKVHREALERLGPTPHHRRSFAPIARFFG